MSELRKDMISKFTNYIKSNTEFTNHTPIEKDFVKRYYNQPIEVMFYNGLELKCTGTFDYSLRIICNYKEIVYYRKNKMKSCISEEEHFQLSLVENIKLSYKNIQELIDMYLNNGYNKGFAMRVYVHNLDDDEIIF